MANLQNRHFQDYIAMLYDEALSKTKASALFLELSENHRNLQQLVENGDTDFLISSFAHLLLQIQMSHLPYYFDIP